MANDAVDIENLLKLPNGYSYEVHQEGEQEIRVYIKEVADEDAALNWINELQLQSKETWRISKTERDGKINSFKQFRYCQHAANKHVKGIRTSKATGCTATLQITVHRHLPKSKSRVKDRIRKEWPTAVTFRLRHNHSTSSAAALKHRDMSSSTRQRLCDLFRQGHSGSSALHCLKTDYLIQYGDSYYLYAGDGYYIPSLSVVNHLFTGEFVAEYGSKSGSDIFVSLELMLSNYHDMGLCCAKFGKIGSNYFVSLCTSLMKRAHQLLPQTGELVMVDAAGGLDRQRHRLYLFVTPTAAGGVPIGAIVTDCEREDVFAAGLSALVECFPQEAFFGRGMPQVFLTDNDLKERQPLQTAFPNARLLLCQFHVLKAVWSWLCNSHHNVSKNDRQEVYMLFKDVLYASSETELTDRYDLLLQLTAVVENDRCRSYFSNLWDRRQDWVSVFRKGLPLRGSNTTNYVEVAFRILKDCVFDRVMAFTLTQLVDFIVIRYEAYMEKRLIDFSNCRYTKALLSNMTPVQHDIPLVNVTPVRDCAGMFNVLSLSGDAVYSVDFVRGFCSCFVGSSGKLCKHASAALLFSDAEICTGYNIVDLETKRKIFTVATGKSPPSNWLLPLNCHALELSVQKTNEQTDRSTESLEEKSSQNKTEASSSQQICLQEPDMARLDALMARIKQGLADSPESFVPACLHMLCNADKYAPTESGLLSAMHTFAKYSGLPSLRRQPHLSAGRRRGVQIGVQPTAVGRRKLNLSGKRKLSAGRPLSILSARSLVHLASHDYTNLGSLPGRKRKAPHNLQQCVYSNTGLGAKKQAKLQ